MTITMSAINILVIMTDYYQNNKNQAETINQTERINIKYRKKPNIDISSTPAFRPIHMI